VRRVGACSTYMQNEGEMHTTHLESLKERHHLGGDQGIDRDQQWQNVLIWRFGYCKDECCVRF